LPAPDAGALLSFISSSSAQLPQLLTVKKHVLSQLAFTCAQDAFGDICLSQERHFNAGVANLESQHMAFQVNAALQKHHQAQIIGLHDSSVRDANTPGIVLTCPSPEAFPCHFAQVP
jgi:hypothetical protein